MDIDQALDEVKKHPTRSCALLWDESFLWGLMAWRALREAGLPFDLLRSEDVRRGVLSHYRMILVPGGWASNKMSALGDQGMEAIRRFVAGGGSYLGICGGAGMATESGLGLLSVTRKPQSERVPSFSGPIRLSCGAHAMWDGIETPVFFVWWPSQFQTEDPNLKVLATYEEAQAGAFSADINMVDGGTIGWAELEKRYGILLDPSRLRCEPGVLEGRFGRGKVILSLVHFDTPGDRNGASVLRNLWDLLCLYRPSDFPMDGKRESGRSFQGVPKHILESIEEIHAAITDLIATGERNFLWYRRNPLLLQWRRGVRGLEYSTLAAMIGEIKRRLSNPGDSGHDGRPVVAGTIDLSCWEGNLKEIREQLIPFCEKAKRLLIKERFYMMNAPLSSVECPDTEISRLRQELFAAAMSHGGQFKRLIDPIDRLLYQLIKEE
ncbi:MAG: BPL-N domain-containing protein [Syntrophales bacterium]|nr:BPL-N domain-containing protein [Syntrophales bacterium]